MTLSRALMLSLLIASTGYYAAAADAGLRLRGRSAALAVPRPAAILAPVQAVQAAAGRAFESLREGVRGSWLMTDARPAAERVGIDLARHFAALEAADAEPGYDVSADDPEFPVLLPGQD